MHLILTGATGLIGSAVLDAMLQNQGVTKISILSRRAVKMADDRKDPRVRVILHSDFNKYDDALLAQLRDAQGCVWALGISQTQVDKDEYVRITKDYALAAAKAFQTLPAAQPSTSTSASPPNPTTSPATTTTPNPEPPFNFIFVSGYGATTSPPRFPPPRLFARVKGETELALAALRNNVPGKSSNFHACSVRPCAVDPGGHAAIQPYVPPLPPILRYGGVAPALRWGVRTFMDGLWSPTPALGRFLTEVAMGRHGEALRGMAVAEKGEENREREGGLVQMVGLLNCGRVLKPDKESDLRSKKISRRSVLIIKCPISRQVNLQPAQPSRPRRLNHKAPQPCAKGGGASTPTHAAAPLDARRR